MKLPAVSALVALALLPSTPLRSQAAETAAPPPAKPAPAPATTQAIVDALSDGELDQVLKLLKENYIKPGAFSDAEQHRAMVQGLLERVAPGAAILSAASAKEETASPFRAEILDGRVGYIRLGATTPNDVAELDATLQKFTGTNLPALILDLRATPPSSEFEQTAEICRRFCPKGKVLFSVKKPNLKQEQILTSKEDPKYHGVIVALVDHNTAGNAEVIAAVLRTHVNAMIMGQQTKGEAAEFAEFPLANDRVLRVAVAEVSLPESVPVFPGGVKPDLVVDVSQETTDALLKAELEKGVSEFVFESERARMNEAALVAGTNPEIDAIQAAQKAKGEKLKTTMRDAVLQRAVDFITTIAIYEKKPGQK